MEKLDEDTLKAIGEAALRRMDWETVPISAHVLKAMMSMIKEGQRAIHSLKTYGYIDGGGELWKPPLGEPHRDLNVEEVREAIQALKTRVSELEKGMRYDRGQLVYHGPKGQRSAFDWLLDELYLLQCQFEENGFMHDAWKHAAVSVRTLREKALQAKSAAVKPEVKS